MIHTYTRSSLLLTVQQTCARLAPLGWKELLLHHGLDITKDALAEELRRPLARIDRRAPGFEDFALEGGCGIEPGRPAHSLLYHALASPNVTEDSAGKKLRGFPTLAEIEAVEDYVFGVEPPSIQDLRVRADAPLAIVVFALEYRSALGTVHQRHADLCFSRTGVSRIGTEEAYYVDTARGFVPNSHARQHGIRVLPCRYSAFIAAQYKGDKDSFGPARFRTAGDLMVGKDGAAGLARSGITDADRRFWIPLHKIFSGSECIRGRDLTVTLTAALLNQKLRKVHLAFLAQGHNGGWTEPAISRPPFMFSEGIAGFAKDPQSSRHLLVPAVHPRLIEVAEYEGRPVDYQVPSGNKTFSSSLNIVARKSGARSAPEYVHARHEIDGDGRLIDLNGLPDIITKVQNGGYAARHYTDYTGDGYIQPICHELALDIPRRIAAYGIVAPPDFYPFVKQQDLMDWWEQSAPADVQKTLWPANPGPPRPLCDERYPGNLSFDGKFSADDDTISAIVSMRDAGHDRQTIVNPTRTQRVSCLPDRAAGVFAPGWDCSIDRIEEEDPDDTGENIRPGVTHLAAYGLGSPFPEDAKLCAALSAFWPAAAPDTTRAFEPGKYAITTPLTDDVIGQGTDEPWDGIPGPRLSAEYDHEVEFQSLAYGDWVETALKDGFDFSRIAKTQSREYELRTLLMARVYETLGALKTEDKRKYCILSFTAATSHSEELKQAEQATNRQLAPDAHRFVVFEALGTRPHPKDFRKSLVRYENLNTFFADPQTVLRFYAGKWEARDF